MLLCRPLPIWVMPSSFVGFSSIDGLKFDAPEKQKEDVRTPRVITRVGD